MRRNYKYKRKKKSEPLVNFLGMFLVIILICAWQKNFFNRHQKFFAPVKNISAFQMPFKTFSHLQSLARKYNIPFEELISVYSLENNFFPNKTISESEKEIEKNLIINYNDIKKKYKRTMINQFATMFKNILCEMKCFPIPNNISHESDLAYIFGDSWERKIHSKIPQGCDIFDRENISGRLPIVSCTDGEIKNISWDDWLGYYIDVKTVSGNEYFYCHLEKFADGLEKNSKIKAGQLLGYMGDTKKEDVHKSVHLHFCINPKVKFADQDFFIDPYLFLRLLEAKQAS